MRDLSDAPKPGSGESLPREKVNFLSWSLNSKTQSDPGRTPSTSPPPAPPSVEYMREGLNHDDIYIMVEDEFLSTAQLFTSHLHHAEYVRLKNAAKARNTSLHPTTNPLARPTDSITTMRAETKKKKEAEARMGKNKAALDKMKSDARSKIAVTSDEDNIIGSEEEYEADTAPWKDTSLQGLMAPAPRKNLTSLSGLQGIQSSTRAAKGYSKPEGGTQSNCARHIIKLPSPQPTTRTHIPSYPSPSKNHGPTARRLSEVSSSSSSSDDLDAPRTRHPQISPKPTSKSHLPTTAPKSKPSDPLTLAAADLFRSPSFAKDKHPNPFPPRKQEKQIRLPDSSPPSQSDEVAAARRRLQQRRERAAAAAAAAAAKKKEEDTNGNVNVNEIPVFLV